MKIIGNMKSCLCIEFLSKKDRLTKRRIITSLKSALNKFRYIKTIILNAIIKKRVELFVYTLKRIL